MLVSYLLQSISAPLVIYLFLIKAHLADTGCLWLCGTPPHHTSSFILFYHSYVIITHGLTYYYQFCLSIFSLWKLSFVRTVCLND